MLNYNMYINNIKYRGTKKNDFVKEISFKQSISVQNDCEKQQAFLLSINSIS